MSNYKKILFTGASGRFGQVFKKIYNSKKYLYPSRKEFNITNYKSSLKYIKKNKPDLIIHCAALSRPMSIHNTNIIDSIETNIIGTSNLVKAC